MGVSSTRPIRRVSQTGISLCGTRVGVLKGHCPSPNAPFGNFRDSIIQIGKVSQWLNLFHTFCSHFTVPQMRHRDFLVAGWVGMYRVVATGTAYFYPTAICLGHTTDGFFKSSRWARNHWHSAPARSNSCSTVTKFPLERLPRRTEIRSRFRRRWMLRLHVGWFPHTGVWGVGEFFERMPWHATASQCRGLVACVTLSVYVLGSESRFSRASQPSLSLPQGCGGFVIGHGDRFQRCQTLRGGGGGAEGLDAVGDWIGKTAGAAWKALDKDSADGMKG
eukprot:3863675-Rhodomonas_salina.3